MIRFLIDSASDYDAKEAESRGIEYVPITVTIGDRAFSDNGELSKDQFYQMIQESEDFPKTAQPSPQEFLDIFER